ncbi:MAG: SDR family oxidoreductase [Chloroflexi bacterium]|nr:SDR family oxidoreductase [Chloroflexota bacterium]
MDLELGGKVAIVTGGSEGIGKATAWRLAAEGAAVVVCARRPDVLDQAVAEIQTATGGKIVGVGADVTGAADCDRVVAAAVEQFGRLDILVNNAGTSMSLPFDRITAGQWEHDLDLKFHAAVRMCRLAVPHMRRGGGGAIVNIAHPGGKAPGGASMPTSISRAAGLALTKALSRDLAPDNVRVNAVCVGIVRSGQHRRLRAERFPHLATMEEYYQEAAREVPLRRAGEAEEVADLIAFLVSARARYITGTAINIDGGRSPVL